MPTLPRRAWLASTAGLAGCTGWWPRSAVVPMPVLREPAEPSRRAEVLVVMLPGVYSVPRDLIDQGFVAQLRAQRYTADVAIADAHFGYAANGTLFERLRDDVLAPAWHQGYRRIWLVGISLGGFASLGLLMRKPEWIEGVLAISPYVGQPALLQRVRAAGGARAYAAAPQASDDPAAPLWLWLGRADATLRNRIHCYTGSQDRLIDGQRLLEAELAPDHVLEVPGDHDWLAWNVLWSSWLARAPWPRA
jgi:pimeloyl-ACP methyl ester carboxylesterase